PVAAGFSAAGFSATGFSAAGFSAAGFSATGFSAAGFSATGVSAAAPGTADAGSHAVTDSAAAATTPPNGAAHRAPRHLSTRLSPRSGSGTPAPARARLQGIHHHADARRDRKASTGVRIPTLDGRKPQTRAHSSANGQAGRRPGGQAGRQA